MAREAVDAKAEAAAIAAGGEVATPRAMRVLLTQLALNGRGHKGAAALAREAVDAKAEAAAIAAGGEVARRLG